MTSLIQRFVDLATGEVTADVNNTKTTTEVLNNVHYPEEYGAVGDGSTDDLSAIQDCLDNESVVSFKPDTTYFVSDVVTIYSGHVTLPKSTTILGDVDSLSTATLLEIGDETQSASDVWVGGGGTVDGDATATKDRSGGIVNVHDGTRVFIDDLEVAGSRRHGFEASHCVDCHFRAINITGDVGDDAYSTSDGGFTKYGSSGDSVSRNVHFYNLGGADKSNGSTDNGWEVDDGPKDIHIHDTKDVHLGAGGHSGEVLPENIHVTGCRVTDVRMTHASGVHFTNCTFDTFVRAGSDTSHPDNSTTPEKGFQFVNCTFVGGSSTLGHINVQNDDVAVRDCRFESNHAPVVLTRGSDIVLDGIKGDTNQPIEITESNGDVRQVTIENVNLPNVSGSQIDIQSASFPVEDLNGGEWSSNLFGDPTLVESEMADSDGAGTILIDGDFSLSGTWVLQLNGVVVVGNGKDASQVSASVNDNPAVIFSANDIRARDFSIANTGDRDGYFVNGDNVVLERIHVSEAGRHGHVVFSGDKATLIDPTVGTIGTHNIRTQSTDTTLVRPDTQVVDQGGTETRIIDAKPGLNLSRNGTRLINNGRGENAGDPSSTGQWNGNAAFAEAQNVIVEDTSNNDLYMAVGGSWVAIGSTA